MPNQHVIKGPETIFKIPPFSFGHALYNSLRSAKPKIILVDLASGQSLTNKEVLNMTILLAARLRSLGVGKGDKIAIVSENRNESLLPAIAALYIGAIAAAFNHAYLTRELKHCINISKPKIIFSTPSIAHNFVELQAELTYLEKVVTFGPEKIAGAENFEEFLYSQKQFEHIKIEHLDPNDVALILTSSGTTGLPKGVMLTHSNLHAQNDQTRNPNLIDLNKDEIVLGVLPIFHGFGFHTTIQAILNDAVVVLMNKFEEKLFLEAIERHKISKVFVVPPIMLFLAKSPLVDKYDLGSLKQIICGGAPLSKTVKDIVKKRLNMTRVQQGYGLTETTLAVLMQRKDDHDHKAGCVGHLIPGISCKVVDLDTGYSLGPAKEGELCFKGPLMMKGYYGDMTSTTSSFDEDGWFHSGDVGHFDYNQAFYIVDRIKELIKYKAYQVAPAELEALLLTHPDIKDAGVVGLPDEKAGELPLAFVVKKEGSDVNEESILSFVNKQVSSHKQLRGGVRFLDVLPKNATGKILRRQLRAMLTE